MSINGTKTGEEFYKNAKKYWNKVEPTIDGMLGGFTQITSVDIKSSKRFLSKYFEELDKKNEFLNTKHNDKQTTRALDCGSGLAINSFDEQLIDLILSFGYRYRKSDQKLIVKVLRLRGSVGTEPELLE